MYRCLFLAERPRAQRTNVFAYHGGESSSVSHGCGRYACLSVALQSSELMYLPVEQLLSRAESLFAKFERGETSYIDEAIVVGREALELCPPGHPMRSVSLTWLAIHLGGRYDQLGATRDFEVAIVLDREALDRCPQGHHGRSMSLNNLAIRLLTRYNQLGMMDSDGGLP